MRGGASHSRLNADSIAQSPHCPSRLAESLIRLGVTHTFEVYNGDHGNRIRERFESQVLRFFSQHLSAR
jgi:hypothetical protein